MQVVPQETVVTVPDYVPAGNNSNVGSFGEFVVGVEHLTVDFHHVLLCLTARCLRRNQYLNAQLLQ